MIEHWLTRWDLAAAYYTPLPHPESQPVADQVAQKLDVAQHDADAVAAALATQVDTYLQDQQLTVRPEDRAYLVTRMREELFGLGVLDAAWHDPAVSEIMVNGPAQIVVERRGTLEAVHPVFTTTDQLLRTIARILRPVGERLDPRNPILTTHLPDGAHVSVVLPPVALNGPCLTLRKFRRDGFTMHDLIRFGSITAEMAEFLNACVQARLNMIVAGGTGSGKTTVMNVLSSLLPHDERIVTVEEVAEFQLKHAHVVALQSRLPDSNGAGGITVRDLLRTATGMRPDRIIIGEVRGPEAFEALQLLGRGFPGSMLALFANQPEQALEQLEMMVKFNHPDLPVPYLRTLIGASIDLIVQVNRLPDGSRKMTAISEVLPTQETGYALHHVVVFQQTGADARGKLSGEFRSQPVSPALAARMQARRIFLPGLMRGAEESGEP
jgi:pilus assembly protein CpaF